MRARLVAMAVLQIASHAGCGSSCPLGLIDRSYVEGTLACCGASLWRDISVSQDIGEVDLAFAKAAGSVPPAHAWLTTSSCALLFEGVYPPPAGNPLPRCTVFLGPVAPGEVSERRKLSPGSYRVWVQAWTGAQESLEVSVDVGLWGERCGGGL